VAVPLKRALSMSVKEIEALRPELELVRAVGRTQLLVSIVVPRGTQGIVESPKRKEGLEESPE
jgi:hypothetical protein